jgi:hypothetical protein
VCKLELRTKGEIENDKIYARTVCGETVGKFKREQSALYSEREGIISGLNHLGRSRGQCIMERALRFRWSRLDEAPPPLRFTFMPRKTFSAETNSLLGAR